MSFASPATSLLPARPLLDWRRTAAMAGTVAVASVQSATFAAVMWLIVAAPGLLG